MAPPVDFSRFGSRAGKSEVERLFDDTKLGECPEAETGGGAKLSPAERATLVINEVSGVLSLYNISDGAWQFLNNIKRVAPKTLSPKQEKWMKEIEAKLIRTKEEEKDQEWRDARSDIPKFR